MFAEVVLPASAAGTFTYSIPDNLSNSIQVGHLVVVQFGKRRHYIGLVVRLLAQKPDFPLKPILEWPTDLPPVPEKVLMFWQWLARYYLCHLGEVVNAALPAGLKLDNHLMVFAGPNINEEINEWTAPLNSEGIELGEYMLRLDKAFSVNKLQQLSKNGVLELRDHYNRKKAAVKQALRSTFNQEEIVAFLDRKKGGPKQKALVIHFLELQEIQPLVWKSDLVPKLFNQAVLNGCLEAGILETYIPKPVIETTQSSPLNLLSEAQTLAKLEIEKAFAKKKPVLLYGLTASGKTEVYSHLILSYLDKGKQVLFLLPEIALTTQMIQRMQLYFGDRVRIYHSQLGDAAKRALWNDIALGLPILVLGARSALLLPYLNLGFIVVDEEHEPSYKQSDPAPRYNARDAALWMGQNWEVPVILGSATPSLELIHLCEIDKVQKVHLNQRYKNFSLPEIQLTDVRKMKADEQGLGEVLVETIKQTIKNGEQVILFQNRRGYSPFSVCTDCGHIPQCKRCDISLTYHKHSNQIRCHYCGYRESFVSQCQSCQTGKMQVEGVGTQRLEEQLGILFPEFGVERLDFDSTRKRDALQNILDRFEQGETHILVGTQMITKGLDFKNVGLVGVISAEGLMGFPDFRTQERAYQLIAQVSGRAGRGMEGAKVLIQTRNKAHELLKNLRDYQYESIYQRELWQRKLFGYPPYTRLVRLILAHVDREAVVTAAFEIGKHLFNAFGDRILGPEEPSIGRLKNRYIRQFLLKIPIQQHPVNDKNILIKVLESQNNRPWMKGIRIIVDVDPM